jgi:hypothetical protein
MMYRRLARNLSIAAVVICGLTASSGGVYAAGFESGAGSSPLEAMTAPRGTDGRAFLQPKSFDIPRATEPLWPETRSPRDDNHSLEALASKISFVGGLILTADHLMRSVDSVMEAAAYRRPDGSYLRLNAEPTSKGFLVGLVMSRPLEF